MIDVVIVAKNEKRHLGAVLSGIRDQKYISEQIEIFVVDNGSIDATVEIARSHQAHVIQCTGRLGKARNAGIKCGANKLVAFLDAHCVPSSNWAESLAATFTNRTDLGAVMGSIENVSERPATAMLAKNSIFASPEKLRQNTVSGLNSPLPWIPTGNCMYTREALEDVGGFDETLFRCEDTDLSWKVILRGYQVGYVPEAKATHYDQAGATSFLRKYYNYGAGAAEIAQLYGLQSCLEKKPDLHGSKLLLDYCYRSGFNANKHQRHRTLGKTSVDQRFRATFSWSAEFNLSLSQDMVFWTATESTVVCVNLREQKRLILEDSSASIFQLLAKHTNRSQLIKMLSQHYEVDEETIATDVDDLVRELIENHILLRHDLASILRDQTLGDKQEQVES